MINYQSQDDDKNIAVELAKRQAKKAIKAKSKALIKKGGKLVARLAAQAVSAVIKWLISLLAGIGLPFLLILGAVLLAIFLIFLATSFFYSSAEEELSPEATELRNYIIEQADNTVDMSKPEQIPYRVPHELIISALQIYDSTIHGKTDKEVVKLMAKTLKPNFEYGKFEGSYETEVTTCSEGSCSTSNNKEKFVITPLVYVEAWDRIYTATYEPHITDWSSHVDKSIVSKSVPKQDTDGNIIPGEYVDVDVSVVTTTKTRAHTFVPTETEEIDYTYFNRVLSEPPFEYGTQDKLTVEALYEFTGGFIKYKEWLNGGSIIGNGGYIGNVTPGASVPAEFMPYYLEAESIYGVDWYFLAALHFVETGFSTHKTMISSVGAEGHMQFMPCTWLGWRYPSCKGSNGGPKTPENIKYSPATIKQYGGYGIDADGNGQASPWDIKDAIFTAASYLSKNGFSKDIDKAIYAYNRAGWYVQKVKDNAYRFRDEAVYEGGANGGDGSLGSKAAQVGKVWIGKSVYVWGGGRTASDIARGRFDCSAFVHWAYAQVGVNLGPLSSVNTRSLNKLGRPVSYQEAIPGDIIFFNTDGRVDGHVGIYMGNGKWIGSQGSTGVAIVDQNTNGYWKKAFKGHVRRITQ